MGQAAEWVDGAARASSGQGQGACILQAHQQVGWVVRLAGQASNMVSEAAPTHPARQATHKQSRAGGAWEVPRQAAGYRLTDLDGEAPWQADANLEMDRLASRPCPVPKVAAGGQAERAAGCSSQQVGQAGAGRAGGNRLAS